MALYNFQKRFVPMILNGEKRHTIRAKRARATRVGEMLHLYTGLRQKGAQLLMRTICTKVETITIGVDGVIWIGEAKLDRAEKESLARADSFSDFDEMMKFWQGRTPFRGDIIHWKFPSTHTTDQEIRKKCQAASVSAQIAASSSRDRTASARKNAAAKTTTKNAASCTTKSERAKSNVRSAR